jgi:prepilin-type N-terminal cleavage/methylation domain-containing protein
MRNQRGFTLVELLVVLLIMIVVTGGIYRLLNSTQRLTRAQTERIDLQSNVRSAAIIVPNELREINTVVGGGATQIDIIAKSDTSIIYRAMRGLGLVCAGTTSTQLRLSSWMGYRAPDQTRDAVYVFNDGAKTAIGSDDSWDSRAVTGVVTGNTCAVGVPATTLNIANLGRVPNIGDPVRTFEVMELSLYENSGQWWLGMRSVSGGGALQPLLGPLASANGIRFGFYDANGAVTAVLGNVKSIVVTVNGVSNVKVSSGGNTNNAYLADQVSTQVALRNALR